jgi:hypothetical protein
MIAQLEALLPGSTVFSTLWPQAEHSYVQISILPRVKPSGDMRISGAWPPHVGQTIGAARESCAGARNVGIAFPRGTPHVLGVCKGAGLLSIAFGNLTTTKNAGHGCGRRGSQ